MILYHQDDADGWCSAAIAFHFDPRNAGDLSVGVPCIPCVGMSYGDSVPWQGIERAPWVYLLDFAFQPWADMERLRALGKPVLWIDHHQTAHEEFLAHQDQDWSHWVTRYDDKLAACELTWDYFYEDAYRIEPVRLCGRYDVWDHDKAGNTLAFQSGLRLRPDCTHPWGETWKTLVSLDHRDLTKAILSEGQIVNRAREQEAARLMDSAWEVEFDGMRLVCINAPNANSLAFKTVWDPARWDAMCAVCYRGNKWTVSFYTDKPGVDVGAFAKRHGGGGHKQAAGFQPEWTVVHSLLQGTPIKKGKP